MRAEALTSAFAVAQEFNFGGGERGVRVRGGGAEKEGEGTYLSIREIIAELGKPTGAPHAENGFGTGGDERPLRAYAEGRGGGDGLSGAHDALTSRSASGARSSAAPDGPRSPTRAAPLAAGGAATLRTFRYRNSTAPSPRLPSPPSAPHRAGRGCSAPTCARRPAAPPQVFFISARSETIPPAL